MIQNLIRSLRRQHYPNQLLDIYVVADNCTDSTARAARRAGAIVYERFDQTRKGKGYAMDYLFRTLAREGRDDYDGYLIFDADNTVDPEFTAEMNKVFDTGRYDAVTCYRSSSNFGDNWISAGYSIWFLREARFLIFPDADRLRLPCVRHRLSGFGQGDPGERRLALPPAHRGH